MFTTATENCINKLRIVGDVDDALAFQLRLQALLSSTDFSVSGVSPSSIVCVRSLPDPRPGTLRLARGELEGAGVWSKALTESLAGKVNRAARPADGTVPSTADCILFADRAEMLACLARDSLGGLLWTRWWWKILLPKGPSSEIIKQLWRDHPQYVPAALDRLERESKAIPFVNALTEDECHELLQHIVRSFALHELGQVCAVSLPFDRVKLSESSIGAPSRAVTEPRAFEQKLPIAPWEQWCGEQLTHDASPGRQRFLGITLMIVRAPAYARSREFARAVQHWQEEISNRIQNLKAKPAPLTQVHDDRQVSSPAANESHESAADRSLAASDLETDYAEPEHDERQMARDFQPTLQEEPPPVGASFGDSSITLDERREPTAVDDEFVGVDDESVGADDESVELMTEARLEFVKDNPNTAAEPSVIDREPVEPRTLDAVGEAPWVEIETQLGGLFYLINLALYLNLYRDFTMPATPEIELNIWDFVALVGAELTGDESAEDPIWAWLAEMSGSEEGESADAGLESQNERRRPPEWLLRLMPSLRARLRAALGSQSDDEAAQTLCRHYARVRATHTHVDVFFGLADLPLEIRFAGLDRDPGWVPAAGRFIAFHFD